MTLETISPTKAKAYLKRNLEYNRSLNPKAIDTFAKEIVNGGWHLAGDPIRFDENGKLCDGQHRLTAVVKAGKAIQVYVIRNIKVACMKVIDSGTARTMGHRFTMHGYKNGTILAASSAMFALLDKKRIPRSHGNPSYEQLARVVDKNSPGFADVINTVSRQKTTLVGVSASAVVAVMVLAHKRGHSLDSIETFAAEIYSGGSGPKTATGYFRNKALENKLSARKWNRIVTLEILCKTFNKFATRRLANKQMTAVPKTASLAPQINFTQIVSAVAEVHGI